MGKADTISIIAAIFRLYGSRNQQMTDRDLDVAVGEATRIYERTEEYLKLSKEDRKAVDFAADEKNRKPMKSNVPPNKIILEETT